MKISPEPDWITPGNTLGDAEDTAKQIMIMIRNRCKAVDADHLIRVWDKNGNRLGTFTAEYFLGLDEEHQLRFIAVSKRMHNMGVSDVQTN